MDFQSILSTSFNIILATLPGAIIGTVIGIILQKLIDRIQYPIIKDKRKRALNGKWKGCIFQRENKKRKEQSIQLILDIKAQRRLVKCKMSVVDENDEFEFEVSGGFFHDRYLRLEYETCGKSDACIDFGSIFLELDDRPDKMVGKIIGYGSLSRDMIDGDIEIKKVV